MPSNKFMTQALFFCRHTYSWARNPIASHRLALHLFLLAFVSAAPGETFAALNQGNYPDWATAQELYEQDCLPLYRAGKFGPFDYNKASSADRNLVERAHFDEHYQAYRLGKAKFQKQYDHNIETPAAGFSYTLWAFPNHPFSLAAMEDLALKNKNDKPAGSQLRIHCYFQRAVRFTPNDPLVRAIYGYYYARRGKKADALIQLEMAESLNVENYSVALYSSFAYFEVKEFDRSLAAAKQAYKLGYQLPGLRKKLERAGIWKD